MNKTELIAAVAQNAGVSKKDAERVVNAALDEICHSLAAGDRVQLSGFGVFSVKDREARTARNPGRRSLWSFPPPVCRCSRPARS